MSNRTDQDLLRDYTGHRSEPAFAELVRRHVNLVYSAALRMVRDAQLAEDVTQRTFTALARNAGKLAQGQVLSGWLHQTAQNLAANVVRSDVRRRAREQEAAAMNEMLSTEDEASWQQIAPHLDRALRELTERDRDVLMLRYFEHKSAREMAKTLGVSDEAAQKRVTRAIERLRAIFAKSGVIVGTSGLVAGISANAVQAAPPGLAAALSITSVAGAAAGSSASFTLLSSLAMTKTQLSILTAIVVAGVVTPLVIYHQAQAGLGKKQNLLQQANNQVVQLTTQVQQLSNQVAQARASRLIASEPSSELLRLRGEVTRLRQHGQEPVQGKAATPPSREEVLASLARRYSERRAQLKQFVLANPRENVPETQLLSETDWLWLAGQEMPETEDGQRRVMSLVRLTAESNVGRDILRPALQEYVRVHNGQLPTDLSQLSPYLKTPLDESILQRWSIVHASQLVNLRSNLQDEDWVITQKAPVNRDLDQRFVFSVKGVHLFSEAPPEHWDVAR